MNDKKLSSKILERIKDGEVRMVPKWRFVLSSALLFLGALIIFFTLLYLASFGIFMLRESGALFVPLFGMRGILIFVGALPLILIGLLLLFVFILEVLVRRYAFIYRRPLLVSVGAILALVVFGGIALERTRIHHELYRQARANQLPPPIGNMYRAGGSHIPEVERGQILSFIPGGFVLQDEDGTSTVLIEAHTRLPFGADFKVGDQVVVFGDEASGTIHAFGVGPAGD